MIQEPIPLKHLENQDPVGTEQHPIGILDQEEEKNQISALQERSRNEAIIKEAFLSRTSLQVTFAIIKTKFKGNREQKNNSLKRQIIQYFKEKINLDICNDYFAPKVEANYENPETKPAGIALIIYGVDFIDTRKIGSMFSIPGFDPLNFIHKIIWINDSCCKIIFFSPQNAQQAIEHLLLDLNAYRIKAQQEGGLQLPKQWFELKPYQIYGIERKLFARYATMNQLQLGKDESLNRYVGFQNAQRGLELYLLKKYKAFDLYESITNQIEFENYRKSVFKRLRYTPKLSRELTDSKSFQDYVFKRGQLSDLNKAVKPIQQKNNHPESINLLDESVVMNKADIQEPENQIQNQAGSEQKEKEPSQTINNKPNNEVMVEEDHEVIISEEPQKNQVPAPVAQTSNISSPAIGLINQDVLNLLASSNKVDGQPASATKNEKNKLTSQLISYSITEPTTTSKNSSNKPLELVQSSEQQKIGTAPTKPAIQGQEKKTETPSKPSTLEFSAVKEVKQPQKPAPAEPPKSTTPIQKLQNLTQNSNKPSGGKFNQYDQGNKGRTQAQLINYNNAEEPDSY